MSVQSEEIERSLSVSGLTILGHFPIDDGEILLPERRKQPRRLAIIGNAGSSIWPGYTAALQARPQLTMDGWTVETVGKIANQFDIRAVYPFDGPPFWPFTKWAIRTGTLFASPIGLTVHSQFGLWHAFRAALLFDEDPGFPEAHEQSPCERCAERPCLKTCPVNAFSEEGYDFKACLDYLSAGENGCRSSGCDARKACPVGQDHRYLPDHATFHMSQLLRAHSQT